MNKFTSEKARRVLNANKNNTLWFTDGITFTDMYNMFWIAELLGFTDWESLERYEEYGDTVKVKIFDIEWDIDEDDDTVLPTELVSEFDYHGDNDELCYTITDWLTDEYEYCHEGFKYEIIEEEE